MILPPKSNWCSLQSKQFSHSSLTGRELQQTQTRFRWGHSWSPSWPLCGFTNSEEACQHWSLPDSEWKQLLSPSRHLPCLNTGTEMTQPGFGVSLATQGLLLKSATSSWRLVCIAQYLHRILQCSQTASSKTRWCPWTVLTRSISRKLLKK